MINLFLDPFIFACPQIDEGFEQFQKYIDDIISWRMLRKVRWASFYVSSQTLDALVDTESYPQGLWEELKQAINALGIRHVQPKDVIKLVDELIQKSYKIEDKLTINDILLDPSSIQCEPSYYLIGRSPIFVEQYHRLLILIGLYCQLEMSEERCQIVITRHLSADRAVMKITGEIIECLFSDPSREISLPCRINSTFTLCENPHGLHLSIDPLTVWTAARTLDDFHTAIGIYIYQKLYTSGPKPLSWAFGPHFIETVKNLGFSDQRTKAEKLLRECAATILGEEMRTVHRVKGRKSGSVSKETSGSQRRDIDYEYHLHYWETDKGPVFDSVVVHGNMKVSRPNIPPEYIKLLDCIPHWVEIEHTIKTSEKRP